MIGLFIAPFNHLFIGSYDDSDLDICNLNEWCAQIELQNNKKRNENLYFVGIDTSRSRNQLFSLVRESVHGI